VRRTDRLGPAGRHPAIPEDFAAYRLPQLLAGFARSRPALRLDIRAEQSLYLRRDLERGDLDLALLKRDAGERGGLAVWPERTTG
jgi:DNA-binding transcriptional LysR family regulator